MKNSVKFTLQDIRFLRYAGGQTDRETYTLTAARVGLYWKCRKIETYMYIYLPLLWLR